MVSHFPLLNSKYAVNIISLINRTFVSVLNLFSPVFCTCFVSSTLVKGVVNLQNIKMVSHFPFWKSKCAVNIIYLIDQTFVSV